MKDAKGHGSNPRGTHASKIDQIGNISLHPNVLPIVQKNPGGFSVKPTTGKMPTSGFMVSIPGHSKIVSEADLHGQNGGRLIEQYAKENAEVLQHPGAHIGGWTDQASGKTYLDVSHNIASMSKAVKAGKRFNQIAIWDVKNSREIHTGGTGA